ncbi:MAG: glycosyl hydrolase family 28 protein [Opitutales bacterium]
MRPSAASGHAHIYPAPEGWPAGTDFKVRVNGQAVFVYQTPVASFAAFACDGPVTVEIEPAFEVDAATVKVRPLRHKLTPVQDGNTWKLELDGPLQLSFEANNDYERPLLLFANGPESDKPDPDDPAVHFFKGGRVYPVGELTLKQGEQVYIEGGAVVVGNIFGERLNDVVIRGHGLLDVPVMENPAREGQSARAILLGDCRGVRVEGLMFHKQAGWTVCPFGCRDVLVRDIKVISEKCTGDGVDIMGTQDVVVEDSFFRTNDDCVAIKASAAVEFRFPYAMANVERVRVRRCILWNDHCGNAIEIGYETRCHHMSDIVFEDIDIIHCEFEGWSSGAAISIHNGDEAIVRDVVFENIRIEDAPEKLFDFRIMHAAYTQSRRKGSIHNVRCKDIAVIDGPLAPSLLDGWWDRETPDVGKVSEIYFENLTYLGQPLLNNIDARMILAKCDNVFFYRTHKDAGEKPSWAL